MLPANQRAGIAADKARLEALKKAQEIQDLKRQIARIQEMRKKANEFPEEVQLAIQGLQEQLDQAAERFVHERWMIAHGSRGNPIDFGSGDAVAFFMREIIGDKLPALVNQFMSRDMRGIKVDAEKIIAECDAEEASLKNTLAKYEESGGN